MKITTKKCPGCGRRVQYIKHDDGTGWFNSHKNRQGELCDEKPRSRPLRSRLAALAWAARLLGWM